MECDRNFMYLGKMLEIIFRWSKIDNSHWYRLINMENNNKGKKAKPTA